MMDKKVVNFVIAHSGITAEDFSKLSWAEQVDYILLHLAGGSNRWCIYKDFMTFMSLFGNECIEMDRQTGENLASVLFTVAMQRLSKGAVVHEGVNFKEQLPSKFWVYSSFHDDYHIMTDDCLKFIYDGLPVAAQFKPTSDYALKIAWGLVEHLDEDGNCLGGFELYCDNANEEGKKLYAKAVEIIENNVSAEDVFAKYSKQDQWKKHKAWLRGYLLGNDCWNDFFKKIGVSTSLFNFRERLRIIKEIKNA